FHDSAVEIFAKRNTITRRSNPGFLTIGSSSGRMTAMLVPSVCVTEWNSWTPSACQPDCSHPIECDVQVLTQQVYHLKTSFTMFAEKFQQVLTFDERYLRVIQDFSRDFVGLTGDTRAQPQHLSGPSDSQ